MTRLYSLHQFRIRIISIMFFVCGTVILGKMFYIQSFQADAAREAGIFHHLITLPTYHETALGVDTLAEGYFGDMGMLAYVKGVQRMEIRRNMNVVKHQEMAGTTIGDHHKEYFAGDNALLAGGKANTMSQFG